MFSAVSTSSFYFEKYKDFLNVVCMIKNIMHNYILIAQMQFAVLIVFAKPNWQHWTSDCDFIVYDRVCIVQAFFNHRLPILVTKKYLYLSRFKYFYLSRFKYFYLSRFIYFYLSRFIYFYLSRFKITAFLLSLK